MTWISALSLPHGTIHVMENDDPKRIREDINRYRLLLAQNYDRTAIRVIKELIAEAEDHLKEIARQSSAEF